MSDRIDSSWTILSSIETKEGDRCVDIFMRPDNSYGFEEFRRDSEDMGRWTGIGYYSILSFDTRTKALQKAITRIQWLRSVSRYSESD